MTETDPFLRYLAENRDDRAKMASLRRGLGQPIGIVPEVSRVVQPWLAHDAPPWREAAYYLIAPLFALHSAEHGTGNMGNHFRDLCEPGAEPPPNVERRFMALLGSDPDDLDEVLRQAVTLLKSRDVAVNWHELLRDVQDWKHPNPDYRARAQKRWSRSFWRTPPNPTHVETSQTTNP